MESMHSYLPFEVPSNKNYPEAWRLRGEIEEITQYSLSIQDALAQYNAGIYDKMDINTAELKEYITRLRRVCGTLGTAQNVFFDLLLELRKMQNTLQEILYLHTKFGDTYIGKPTSEGGKV